MDKFISDERECILSIINDATEAVENTDKLLSLLYNLKVVNGDIDEQLVFESTHEYLYRMHNIMDRMRAGIDNV